MNLIEIVPNLSEGRDDFFISRCGLAIADAGARVIHVTSDRIHHRSVITAVGSPQATIAAAVALAGVARDAIDLRAHSGAHPRMGALDVLPFVPLGDATIATAIACARQAADQIWERFAIPSFFYGEAATRPDRALLADVRRGEFEGLAERFTREAADVGDAAHASAGAIAVGARRTLVAFNVELESGDLALAKTIAATLRERGGGLQTLRALGLRLGPTLVQVSFNITDVEATPIYRVVELVRALAGAAGVALRRSELIGLVPSGALERSAAYYRGDARS